MLSSPLTIFALAIAPIVTVIFVVFYWRKRDPVSQPSIVAAAALWLELHRHSSGAELAGYSGRVPADCDPAGCRYQSCGFGLMRAQRPLAWGLLDVAICLVVTCWSVSFFATRGTRKRRRCTPMSRCPR